MTDYLKHKRENYTSWWSSSFYSGPGGYKLCISVHANGDRDAAGTHVSAYLYLMKGEYDNRLQWPFIGIVTIQLLNQKSDQYHCNCKWRYNGTEAAAQRVTSRGQYSESGWGYRRFISHDEVESITSTKQYIRNDSLKFRVAKITC